MRFIKVRKNSRRVFVLTAAGLAMLACAGTGLAGVFVPLPTKKPDSIQSTAQVLGLMQVSYAADGESVPLPPVKPKRLAGRLAGRLTGPVLTAPDNLGSDDLAAVDMDQTAEILAKIEPASFTPATGAIPVPSRKPDFVMPDVSALLSFGQAPVSSSSASAPKAPPQNLDPLSAQDAALYRKIFAAQSVSAWDVADENIALLRDLRLRGHVLFDRYMHPGYKASFAELQSWMDLYNDLPGADRIYKLASSRKPSGAATLKTARNQVGVRSGTLNILSTSGDRYQSEKNLTKAQVKSIAALVSAVRSDISHGAPSKGLRRLSSSPAAKLMDNVEYDQLRSQIASGYLLLGKPDEAKTLAIASAKRSGAKAPLAGWTGGLASWREKDYATAAKLFEQVAKSPYTSSWMNSAGAYWASRSHMRAGHSKEVSIWLKEAARHPRTFYGLIATRALGWDFDFDWSTPEFTKDDYKKLVKIPAAWRAMALVQAGQNHLAESELLQINAGNDVSVKTALLAYTQQVNLPSLAMRIANNTVRPNGKLYDSALYPLLPWQPEDGYTVDRALIFAIIRQESKFNTWAESTSGATGLMQIMPSTASYVDGTRDFKAKSDLHRLKDPETNLAIGQKYVEQLLGRDGIDKDLMSLAIAYNAGPGNLRKWKKGLADIDDPLLFIEMIPMAETRSYVERVLANYWIYELRMNLPVPSLDSVAEGKWAQYIPMDNQNPIVRLGLNLVPKTFNVADTRD